VKQDNHQCTRCHGHQWRETNRTLWSLQICPNPQGSTLFLHGKLISYDTVADLAVLELATSAGKDFIKYSNQSLSIGSSVIAYGYPAIGGSNITRTEGKIWGTEGENYKFDGTIDHGNSGGGAFDKDGKLVGIPYAVSSDNGVIGYIIPVNTVKEFLAGKTYDIQKHKTAPEQAFLTYIKIFKNSFKTRMLWRQNTSAFQILPMLDFS
jgi:hypothetical protein